MGLLIFLLPNPYYVVVGLAVDCVGSGRNAREWLLFFLWLWALCLCIEPPCIDTSMGRDGPKVSLSRA